MRHPLPVPRPLSRRRQRTATLAALAAGTLMAGALTATTVLAHAAAAGCSVSYKITNQWAGGFGGDVTVTNLGDPVTAWSLTWNFAPGQSVVQAWNATVTQSGTAATAVNLSYNGALASGGSVNFGFNG